MSFTLNAQSRSELGKGASRRLRRTQKSLPAIIYGANQAPQNITILQKDIFKAMEDESFFSSVVKLNIDGTESQVIIKDLQRHPAKPIIYHADFQRVDDSKQIIVNVPLHFVNKESCVGVKLEGGRLSVNATTIEIQCLPSKLPEYLEVDLLKVHAGTILHLSDVVLPEGVESVALLHGEDHNQPIAQITSSRGAAKADAEQDAADVDADESAEGDAEEGAE